tara:strand:+ start:189 stop:833 length:645 start_codon:yes stop_codon:yes gene_type:complete
MEKVIHRVWHVERAAKPPTMEGATFIASTAVSDRYGDIVDQASWKLDNYRMNPIIQVDHCYEVEDTVGRGARVDVVDNHLEVDIVWGKDAASQLVGQKVMEGLISAVSVGFRPNRATARHLMPEDDPYHVSREENPYGMVYYDCELLEISVVAVPANPEALAQRSANPALNLDKLVEAAVSRVLATLDERRTLAAPVPVPSQTPSLADWLKGTS